jgi:hypothetical protein
MKLRCDEEVRKGKKALGASKNEVACIATKCRCPRDSISSAALT